MIELLGYSAVALLFTKYFSPIQPAKAWVVTKLVDLVVKTRQWWFMDAIQVLTCPKCFSFWFTLAMTFNLWSAAIVSIFTMIINLVIEKLQDGND
jgi:hypothetical protein